MSNETKVGAFTVLGLVLLSAMLFFLSDIHIGSSHEYTVYALFDHVIGLNKSAKVRLAGVPVGKVVNIESEDKKVRVTMKINGDAQIPRDSETAEIVSFLTGAFPSVADIRVLDLCCGSGCIGIELSLAFPNASVTCADLSPDALKVAARNASDLGATICLAQGNLFEAVPNQTFDLIVSNPPYIPSEECDIIQPEVSFEPRMALDGGNDGLDFYRTIIAHAFDRLSPGGMIAFEVGDSEAESVASLLRTASFESILIRNDFSGIPRMVAARKPVEVLSCSKNLNS